MPELPELEVAKDFLVEHLVGRRIEKVEVLRPIVVRNLADLDFASPLEGQAFTKVERRGKFLVFSLDAFYLVINPMLSGRLYFCPSTERRLAKTFVIWHLEDGIDLRYVDEKQMGKIYLTADLSLVPGFAMQRPEALEVTFESFKERLKRHRGEIKGVLADQTFVAGIGNAYADEILFRAGVYPFKRRPRLTGEEIRRLYEAMRAVLEESIANIHERMGDQIHLKFRDFLAVHGKGGSPCPRCGTPISEVSARGRLTNFCRSCQPGIMIGKSRSLRG
jgi:formamidopyrimidine-DNA glycosylase